MNPNSVLSLRDDVAFGVYDLDTDQPEVAVIQLKTHEFFHFEDDAARIMAPLLNGQSMPEVLNQIHARLAEMKADENAYAEVGAFLDEFLPKIFVIGDDAAELAPQEPSFSSPDTTNDPMGEPRFFDICDQKDRLALACCELTYSCQLRCQHCYNPHHKSNDILTTDEWLRFARQARALGVLRVILTGGDPLCHPGFWEIVTEFHRLHIAIDVYTNGQVLSDPVLAQRLASFHPRSIQCSVYATSAEIHDAITTVPGSWAKTIECLKNFKNLDIPIVIKMPIMKPNFGEHTKMAAFAKGLGATLQVDLGIIQKLDGCEEPVQLRLDDEHMYSVMQNKDLSLYQFTQRFTDLNSMRLPDANPMCNAGHGVFDVSPTGTVLPCINFLFPLGELRENTLQEIAKGEQLKYVRSLVRKNRCDKCQKCDMASFCAFCPGLSLLEKNDYLADNSLSCQNTRVYRMAAK
ncbi:MAG: radical SAM protein [Planctomycetia bacterium]|nr:radical SAM protein [Planctomycetia bacterium]